MSEPSIFTEAELQAHREADIMARVHAIEERELQVPSAADEEKLFLANLCRELYAKVIAQRAGIAGLENGQGILGGDSGGASKMRVALEALMKWSLTDRYEEGGDFSHLAEVVIPLADEALNP